MVLARSTRHDLSKRTLRGVKTSRNFIHGHKCLVSVQCLDNTQTKPAMGGMPTTNIITVVTVLWQVQGAPHQDRNRAGHGRCPSTSCSCASCGTARRLTPACNIGCGAMGSGARGGYPVSVPAGSSGATALGPAP